MPIRVLEPASGQVSGSRIRVIEKAEPTGYDKAKSALIKATQMTPPFLPKPVQDFMRAEAVKRLVAAQGAGLGWVDEAMGAAAAGGQALTNLVKDTGISPRDAYRATRDVVNETIKQRVSERPVESTALMLAGGAATGGPAAKAIQGATTLPNIMLRSAGVGAAYGGVSGAGAADEGERLEGATKGAFVGGIVGGATPYVTAGGAKVVKKVARPVINAVGNASKRLPGGGGAVGAAARAVPSRAELDAAKVLQDAMEADALAGRALKPGETPMYSRGRSLQGVYDVLAQTPGPGASMIEDAATAARREMTPQLRRTMAQELGGRGDYLDNLDALAKARGSAARDGMATLGRHEVTLDRDSVVALRAKPVQDAIREVADLGLASPDPDIRNSAVALRGIMDRALDGERVTMSVREAQAVSEALNTAARSAFGTQGGGGRGAALAGLGRAIRTNARTPERGGFAEYDAWLRQYGADSDRIAATELGAGVRKGGLENSPEAVQRALGGMDGDVRPDYAKGVAEDLLDFIGKNRGDAQLLRSVLGSDNLQRKLRMAFPDDASFVRFIQSVEESVRRLDLNNRYINGSQTYARAAARASAAQDGTLGEVAGELARGRPVQAGSRGIGALLAKMLPQRPDAYANPQANAAMGRTASDPAELERLIRALTFERRLQLTPTGRALVGRSTPALAAQAGSRN